MSVIDRYRVRIAPPGIKCFRLWKASKWHGRNGLEAMTRKEALRAAVEATDEKLDEQTIRRLGGLIEVRDVTPLRNTVGQKEYILVRVTPAGKKLLQS